jgi:hypothetical protein
MSVMRIGEVIGPAEAWRVNAKLLAQGQAAQRGDVPEHVIMREQLASHLVPSSRVGLKLAVAFRWQRSECLVNFCLIKRFALTCPHEDLARLVKTQLRLQR